MNLHIKTDSEGHRRICQRISDGLNNDREILDQQNAIRPVLEREFREAQIDLRESQQARQRARTLADAASMISQLPMGRVGRIIGGGVSALTGINAANEADGLDRIVNDLDGKIRTLEREMAISERLITQHRRLFNQSQTAWRVNNCGTPDYF
ncbi:MAG: hypothetical protein JKY32_03760 [Rhizobiales bacterium]|nr:hypothetical protein [Hyphomicrobiales bacterium]